jgi:Fe-S cluster assembly protein SufB
MEDLTKKKTYVEDIERSLYDIRDKDRSSYKSAKGLTEDIVRDISRKRTNRNGCCRSGCKP